MAESLLVPAIKEANAIEDIRYEKAIEEFIERCKNADDESKDSVFYLCGKYEFDEMRSEAIEIIADLLFEKASASEGGKYPYHAESSPTLRAIPENGVYKDPSGEEPFLPQHVAQRVARRKKIEAERKKNGLPVYIPNLGKSSLEFRGERDFAARAYHDAFVIGHHYDPYGVYGKPVYSNTKSFGCGDSAIKKEWMRMSANTKILCIILCLCVMISIIASLVN